ncbi:MAG: YhcH/YjgK/YiaL family protein, partial [Spirochaetales bacterium]|nr:YhcH/YjgK/YiaL family protein [Candidatus Physcosoma equi]
KFIDIHMMLIGEEYYDCARILKDLPEGFAAANDIGFFESAIETRVKLTPGVWAVSYPFEPHRPRVSVSGKPEKTKKIVVKIPYEAK